MITTAINILIIVAFFTLIGYGLLKAYEENQKDNHINHKQ